MRIDLQKRTANILISDAEYMSAEPLRRQWRLQGAKSQTPWQEIQRKIVDELGNGMTLKPAVKYRRIAKTMGIPRDNH